MSWGSPHWGNIAFPLNGTGVVWVFIFGKIRAVSWWGAEGVVRFSPQSLQAVVLCNPFCRVLLYSARMPLFWKVFRNSHCQSESPHCPHCSHSGAGIVLNKFSLVGFFFVVWKFIVCPIDRKQLNALWNLIFWIYVSSVPESTHRKWAWCLFCTPVAQLLSAWNNLWEGNCCSSLTRHWHRSFSTSGETLLVKLPSCLIMHSQKITITQPTNQNQKKTHRKKKIATKPPKQNKTKKTPNKQHPQNKKTSKQPLLLQFFLVILLLLSHCVLLCSKYTSPIVSNFLGCFLLLFFGAQIYFSGVKSAHKCLWVWNCPRCLSAVTALFLLAELQCCSQHLP